MNLTRPIAGALLSGALASMTPLTATAQAIPIGHLADFSGATADVGGPYG